MAAASVGSQHWRVAVHFLQRSSLLEHSVFLQPVWDPGTGNLAYWGKERGATSVQGDSGSIAFSFPLDSLIRGSSFNSLYHHPIHPLAHSCLASEFVGPLVGAGVGVCAGVRRVVSSGVDDEDDACMDGVVTDVPPGRKRKLIERYSLVNLFKVTPSWLTNIRK